MRFLTEAQYRRLEALDKAFPDPRVVGWQDDGPVVLIKGVRTLVNRRGGMRVLVAA